jgi:YidC/Oxa1 family membrane protein insertase
MTPVFANVIQDAFSPLINAFESILVFLHDHVIASWGLAIIGLTLLVRAVMVPLTVSQFRSMARMRELQPQMKEIQKRYKDDRQRQSEELMKFYKTNNVNPFASCLPLLLQLPVFISLFYMLRKNLKTDICGQQLVNYYNDHPGVQQAALHHVVKASQLPNSFVQATSCNKVAPHSARFLFIPDLTSHATGIALIVLLVLYVCSQLGASWVMTVTADPTQRRLMLLLPLVFVAVIFSFPAGLLVYWVMTNFWTLGQSLIIQRRMHSATAAAAAAAPADKSDGKARGPTRGEPQPQANGGGPAEKKPALAAASASSGRSGTSGPPGAAPPPPPRKRKKRSGRRR